jgi:hypothetical protein
VSEPPLRFLVGTVSRCHGAVNLLTAVSGTDTVSQSGFTAREPIR